MFKTKVTFTGDTTVEVMAGRSSLWDAQDAAVGLPESDSKNLKSDYLWAYFAAKQAGKLDELGVKEDTPRDEAIAFLGDHYDLAFERADDAAPLASKVVK